MENLSYDLNIEENDLLLIIDMQNVYLPGQPWACPNIKHAIPYIKKKISEFPENQIIFTKYLPFHHPKGIWKDYNIRSEEHTSELQSRFDLVCRLLLAKKKTY